MIGPDGSSADIPLNRVNDALSSGGKLAVAMTSPDGKLAYIPHENVMAAIKAGGKMGTPSANAMADQNAGDSALTKAIRPYAQAIVDTQGQMLGAGIDQLKATGATLYNQVRHPIDNSIPGMAYAGAKDAMAHMDTPKTLAEGAGQLGVDIPGAKQAYAEGNIPSAVQKIVNPVAQAMILKKAGEFAQGAPSPSELFQQMRPRGPQTLMYPKAAALPPPVVNATEDIFRAAAPTNTNLKFRESLYTAAPDLAEVARKLNLGEAKGGIINPDMRVNATVKAIDAHLADMYKTEREPQIEPYKNQTVENKLDFDAKNGLRYLVKNAGQVGDRYLAAKALNGDPMTAGGLNRLAIVTNEELTPLRSMTPQERMAAQLTNKKLSGLKSLDKGLSNNLNDFLQAQGEPGLRGYEQRYAALSDVRNGLRPRINATELERNIDLGLVGKGIKAVTGGKSGIASASQAAVADINIGKKLQGAMKVLAESNLKPNRAIRRASAMSSPQPPAQSQ